MTSLHSQHLNTWTYGVNLIATSVLTQNMTQMFLHGGTGNRKFTPAFWGWQWTTSQYQVIVFSPPYPKFKIVLSVSIATSIDVEHVFSKAWILLSHICSCLPIQSTCALICVGAWSLLGYMKDRDVRLATVLSWDNSSWLGLTWVFWNSWCRAWYCSVCLDDLQLARFQCSCSLNQTTPCLVSVSQDGDK